MMNPRMIRLNTAKRIVILEGFSNAYIKRIVNEYEFQKNIDRLIVEGVVSKVENSEFEKYRWKEELVSSDKCNSIVIQNDLDQFCYFNF